MKKFERLLKGHKSLVFLDFEGTQFSHEMIAIGAMHVSIDRNGRIKKHKKPFRIYVKAHNRVGKIVTDLTGITDEMLKQKGVSFFTAMSELKKYVGLSFRKSSFITFGSHDMKILLLLSPIVLIFQKKQCKLFNKTILISRPLSLNS